MLRTWLGLEVEIWLRFRKEMMASSKKDSMQSLRKKLYLYSDEVFRMKESSFALKLLSFPGQFELGWAGSSGWGSR